MILPAGGQLTSQNSIVINILKIQSVVIEAKIKQFLSHVEIKYILVALEEINPDNLVMIQTPVKVKYSFIIIFWKLYPLCLIFNITFRQMTLFSSRLCTLLTSSILLLTCTILRSVARMKCLLTADIFRFVSSWHFLLSSHSCQDVSDVCDCVFIICTLNTAQYS